METGTAKTREHPRRQKARYKKKSGRTTSERQARQEAKALRAAALKRDTLVYATDILVAILTDGFNTLPFYRYADYRKDVDNLKSRIQCEGLHFVFKVIPGLIQGVFDTLEGRPASYPGFQLRGGIPVFLGRCVQNAIEGKTEYIRFIYQMSVAMKKLKGKYSKKGSVEKMWQKYVTEDDGLRDIDWFQEDRFRLIERARHYAKKFYESFDPHGSDNIPRPGPGATNTPMPAYRRFTPSVVYDQIDRVFPTVDWFYHNPWAVNDQARSYLALPRLKEPLSRYKPVPKTALELRGICIEENEVQFFQQGLRRAVTKHINRHPLYCRRILLHDQSVNQWLALISSKDRTRATLDLHAASDLEARELVSWIHQDNQDMHDALMALSTKWVLPPKECKSSTPYRIAKFAPMGSALCFPIMSLTIMFIIRAAISLSDLPYPHLLSTNVFVYGDDIVVPSSTYTLVTDALETVGFKVNLTKSFVKSHFRESCGVHAYSGIDITPVFCRKLPSSSSLTSMLSLIESEHQFYEKNYMQTASVMRAYGAKLWPKHFRKALYVPKDSPVVGWKRCADPHVGLKHLPRRIRWNTDLQLHEGKAMVVTTKPPLCSLVHGSDALLRWIAYSPEPFKANLCIGDKKPDNDFNVAWRWEPLISGFIR